LMHRIAARGTPATRFGRLETAHATQAPEPLKVIGVSRAGQFVHFRVVTPIPGHFFSGLFCETGPVVGIEVIAESALDGIKAEAGAF
jgi:hypothetical protein